MTRKLLLGALVILGVAAAFPSQADAGYTVYIYNVRRPSQGWIRTGFTHDLFTTWSRCQTSINNRIAENRRYGTDFEGFAIVETSRTPPAGRYAGGRFYCRYAPPGYRCEAAPEVQDAERTTLLAWRRPEEGCTAAA